MKKISHKLIFLIVPVVMVALLLQAVVSVEYSKSKLEAKMDDSIRASMENVENNIHVMLSEPETTTDAMAKTISSDFQLGDDLISYENAIKEVMSESDYIIAMGIFLDPTMCGNSETASTMTNYYWTKDGSNIAFTDIGQGLDMDLRGTEWWKALAGGADYFYTETYIDTTIGTLMCSYVVPIKDKNGNFVGAFNTDISMGVVEDMINNYTIGETGKCRLFQKVTGQHLTGVDSEQILNEESTILTENASGLDKVGQEILDNEVYEGKISGTDNSYICYATSFDTYDWILVTLVEQSETANVIKSLRTTITILAFVSTVVCVLIITLLASSIAKPIRKVEEMAEVMAGGDFTMEPLVVKGQDEVSHMTEALNKMLESNKREMSDISDNSKIVSANSETLQSAVRSLQGSFSEISEAISSISSAMLDNNSTTEELSASVAEVKEAVSNLAAKASESEKMSSEIMDRAKQINKESTANFDNAMKLTKQYEMELNGSIENSKVVEEIGIMADAINDIASQINLLSLNASIEAARAGDAGRGFAVVATEIGNLAAQTSTTVSDIQETIVKVKDAVTTLADNSGKIIKFINDSVTPDYKGFVDVSVQYEEDAVGIQELSEYVSSIASTLSNTMEEFTNAIQNIANMSQNTSDSAAAVLSSVDVVSENVENVDNISSDQMKISQELDSVVARYKL